MHGSHLPMSQSPVNFTRPALSNYIMIAGQQHSVTLYQTMECFQWNASFSHFKRAIIAESFKASIKFTSLDFGTGIPYYTINSNVIYECPSGWSSMGYSDYVWYGSMTLEGIKLNENGQKVNIDGIEYLHLVQEFSDNNACPDSSEYSMQYEGFMSNSTLSGDNLIARVVFQHIWTTLKFIWGHPVNPFWSNTFQTAIRTIDNGTISESRYYQIARHLFIGDENTTAVLVQHHAHNYPYSQNRTITYNMTGPMMVRGMPSFQGAGGMRYYGWDLRGDCLNQKNTVGCPCNIPKKSGGLSDGVPKWVSERCVNHAGAVLVG